MYFGSGITLWARLLAAAERRRVYVSPRRGVRAGVGARKAVYTAARIRYPPPCCRDSDWVRTPPELQQPGKGGGASNEVRGR